MSIASEDIPLEEQLIAALQELLDMHSNDNGRWRDE